MGKKSKKPDCYECINKGGVSGSCHSSCNNSDAKVKGDTYGASQGWFFWPSNFDPVWLISCDGFKQK